MEKKAYSLGIIIGRFQVLHLGHVEMINKAIELCDEVGIFIGSSQESNTLKNPLSFEKRKEILETIFGDKVTIKALPDIGVGNNSAWGDYVLTKAKESFGRIPDLLISGKEERRTSWLSDSYQIAEIFVPKTIDISATKMIQFLLDDNKTEWQKYIDSRLYPYYDELRSIALEAQNNLKTSSL